MKNEKCANTENETSLPGRYMQIDTGTMQQMKHTLGVMLACSANIQNTCRVIERNSLHADDALILGTLGDLRETAGDLMEAWGDLDLHLSAHIII